MAAEDAEIIKIGDNVLYRLPDRIVARVSRPGRTTAAFKEVAVARWLARLDVPAVRALDGVDQPVQVDDRCITFWQELHPHHNATNGQVATALHSRARQRSPGREGRGDVACRVPARRTWRAPLALDTDMRVAP